MKKLQNLTENNIKSNLKLVIKEAILNNDKALMESIIKTIESDEELLQEAFPILAVLGALMAVGTAVEVSDILGFTDNLYDDVVKYADPIHWVGTGASKLAIEAGLLDDSWDSPFIGATPDRLESGWGLKLIKNALDDNKELFDEIGLDPETKSEKWKRMESGESTVRDGVQDLYIAMQAGSDKEAIRDIIEDPETKDNKQPLEDGWTERDNYIFWIADVYEDFSKYIKERDDSNSNRDLIWWLKDEGELDKQANIVKNALITAKELEGESGESGEDVVNPEAAPAVVAGSAALSANTGAKATGAPSGAAAEDKLANTLLDLHNKVKSGKASKDELEVYNILGL